MLSTEYDPVLLGVTQLIVYWIAQVSKQSGNANEVFKKVGTYLLYIKQNVKETDFAEFCKNYFQLIISAEWSDEPNTELLVQFANAVFKQQNLNNAQMKDESKADDKGNDNAKGKEESFFFLSDIQILIDTYERCLADLAPNCEEIHWVLDGLQNVLIWPGYCDGKKLNQYKSDEILTAFNDLEKVAAEEEIYELGQKLDDITKLPKIQTALS